MPYITESQFNKLKEVMETASMENASFGNDEHTDMIRRDTKIWRETWIIGQLKGIVCSVEEKRKIKEARDAFPRHGWLYVKYKDFSNSTNTLYAEVQSIGDRAVSLKDKDGYWHTIDFLDIVEISFNSMYEED